MTAEVPAQGDLQTPGLKRRLACFLYEGVLLFGIVMAVGLVYGIATGQRNAVVGVLGLQALLFVVIGAYFVWFWSGYGQTLAMQTWHIRVLTQAGAPLSRARALTRYLCSYLWFAPALLSMWAMGLVHRPGIVGLALASGVVAYAALARLHPQRQYLHDALCGTRLVSWAPRTRN